MGYHGVRRRVPALSPEKEEAGVGLSGRGRGLWGKEGSGEWGGVGGVTVLRGKGKDNDGDRVGGNLLFCITF